MKNIKLFTILFFSVLLMNAQKKENSKLIKNQVAQKGGAINDNNVIAFTPANQTINASSGIDAEATIQVNCTGGNSGYSSYNLVVVSLPDSGFQSINTVNTNMVPGDVHDRIFTFNLTVSTPTTSTYNFRADWYDEVGGFHQKNLNITVSYTPNDADGDGVIDSQDDCPNEAGPASNNGCPEVCNLPSPSNRLTTDIGDTEATLNWNNVSGNEGYEIKYRKGSGSYTTVVVGSNITSYELSNLDPSSSYSWIISTKCNGFNGSFSSSVSFTTLALCNLNSPSGLRAFNINANNAAITWNSVSGSSGYHSQYKEINSSNWIDISYGIPPTGFSISNLQPEITYQIRVRTQCSNGGYGNWSQIEQFTTPLCGANAPSSITISSTNSNYTTVSWSSVSGSYGYNSEYREVGTSNWITISIDNYGTGFSIVNLSPSTSYEVRVRTRCQNGYYGEWGNETFTSSARMAQINIFPNPAKDKIKIESIISIKNHEVVNSFGKKQNLKIDSNNEINISKLPLGLYSITIEFENGDRVMKRFVKE